MTDISSGSSLGHRRWRIFQFGALLCFGALVISPVLADDLEANASARFYSICGPSVPNVNLPADITAPDGMVTLFVRFAEPKRDGYSVYIINRSKEPLVFSFQGGESLTLAVQDDEEWRRAQSHILDSCGESNSRVLPPGQHVISMGYQPKAGIRGLVRYQLGSSVGRLISNEGIGLWNPDDLYAAGVDQLAEQEEPELLFEREPGKEASGIDKMLLQLSLLKSWSNSLLTQQRIRRFREELVKLKAHDEARANQAIARIDEIAAIGRAAGRSDRALLDSCLDVLNLPIAKGPQETDSHPEIAWHFLKWLSQNPGDLTTDAWRDVFERLKARIPLANKTELFAIANFINMNPLVHEFLDSQFLTDTTIAVPALFYGCVERLGNRAAWGHLTIIGNQAYGDKLMFILRHMCVEPGAQQPRPIRNSMDPHLFECCLEFDPWESFYVMLQATGHRDRMYMEPGLSLRFLKIFDDFVSLAETSPFPFSNYSDMVGLVQYLKNFREWDGISPGAKKRLERVSKLGEIQIEGESEERKKCRQQIKAAADRILVR